MSTYLGQNFLNNLNVLKFIIQDIKSNANLDLQSIEIGPGKGALTQYLNFIDNLKVFEKDTSFLNILTQFVNKKNIIFGDFLSANLSQYTNGSFFNAFGNLPYYITSPIFRKLCDEGNLTKMQYGIFMIQKEVGEKIKTNSNKKSLLWFLLNYNYDIFYLKTIPAEDFTPTPKVESCLVRFVYHGRNLNIDFNRFQQFMILLSSYKRKTLLKIQKILQKQGKKLILNNKLEQKRSHELDREDISFLIQNNF